MAQTTDKSIHITSNIRERLYIALLFCPILFHAQSFFMSVKLNVLKAAEIYHPKVTLFFFHFLTFVFYSYYYFNSWIFLVKVLNFFLTKSSCHTEFHETICSPPIVVFVQKYIFWHIMYKMISPMIPTNLRQYKKMQQYYMKQLRPQYT